MNKIWITIILLVAVAVGGYAWWSTQDDKLTEDTAPMVTPEAPEPADDAVVEPEPEAEEESGLLDDATDAMDDAAAAATDAVDDAVEAMDDAVDAATDAADTASDTAAETASDGAEAAEDAMEAATDTAGETADTTTDAATESATSITDLLTVENFDADEINTMIDESALGEMQKAELKTAVDAAGDSPEEIEAVIDQIKQAMGL